MRRFSSDNNNFPYDNNILVLDMVLSSLWGLPQPINWDNVAKLVPGFTPKECAHRFEELKSTVGFPHLDNQCNTLPTDGSSPSDSLSSYIKSNLDPGDSEEMRTSQSNSTMDGSLHISTFINISVFSMSYYYIVNTSLFFLTLSTNLSPNMVIHVCDEAKNLKRDFTCARDLLVKEMRYFAEYLSVDSQRWEEVDISVHCDVQIFDWLMNYVRRNTPAEGIREKPRLEPSNVISILISSEFLKMDTLVEECIQYCHKHMSAIVATPCNMNCINSNLAMRVADLFNHNEADDVRDKKDKFKSKLFQKKIERLFDPSFDNRDSPGNASTLYRCGLCHKLLTKDTERRISCVPGKIYIDAKGEIAYSHIRQKSWEVHDYLSNVHEELKSWVLVYWRIWGTINSLTCSRCQQVFVCAELTHCRYHPESVQYPGMASEKGWHGTGLYPCCNQRVLRFDPSGLPKGCKMRDHIVSLPDEESSTGNPVMWAPTRVLNDLLLHRDTVLGAIQRLNKQEIAGERVCVCGGGGVGLCPRLLPVSDPQRQQCLLSEDEEYTTGSEITEDEVGDEEELSKKQAAKKGKRAHRPLKRQMSSPSFQRKEKSEKVNSSLVFTIHKSRWDSKRSLRYNQDAQREEDQRRTVEIISHLTKMRFGDQEQSKSKDTKEVGCVFVCVHVRVHFKMQIRLLQCYFYIKHEDKPQWGLVIVCAVCLIIHMNMHTSLVIEALWV
uniref:SANT and BTB domain regulator of CSR n=1 Tax=Gadus morhua TaxID=8049 RepID=A0A8C4ZUP8_GADMO